jgi:hypothetical protein
MLLACPVTTFFSTQEWGLLFSTTSNPDSLLDSQASSTSISLWESHGPEPLMPVPAPEPLMPVQDIPRGLVNLIQPRLF